MEKSTEIWNAVLLIPWREEPGLKELVVRLTSPEVYHEFSEIIFINDHNDSEERNLLEQWIREFSKMRIVDLPEHRWGKKEAILFGIESSVAECIVTLDADCMPTDRWIEGFRTAFRQPEVVMVLGTVTIADPDTPLECVQALEQWGLNSITEISVHSNSPLLASGASLGFRRNWFAKAGGYGNGREVSSGDDMYLLRQIRLHGGKVAMCKTGCGVVETRAVRGFSAYFAQRYRWLSKMAFFPDKLPFLLFLFDLGIRLFVSILPLIYWLTDRPLGMSFIPLFLRLFIDLLLVFLPAIRSRHPGLLAYLIPGYLIILWVHCRILLGLITGKEQNWKGRRVRLRPSKPE